MKASSYVPPPPPPARSVDEITVAHRLQNATPIGQAIIVAASEISGVPLITLTGGDKNRTRRVSTLRTLICGLIDEHTPSMTMWGAALALGLRSHASVFEARERYRGYVDGSDPDPPTIGTLNGELDYRAAADAVADRAAVRRGGMG